jgi:hypothetical protein
MRRANTGHRDANEAAIVTALRAAGAAVAIMAPPMPDLLVQYGDLMVMIEVKERDAGKATRGVKTRNHAGDVPACLTPAQVTWWRAWISAGGDPPVIALDAAEALSAIGAVPKGPTE